MHISAKIMFVLTVVCGLIGVVLMVIGVDKISDIEDFQYEEISSGELIVDDNDNQGDAGFTIYVEGVYGDNDGDGKHDVCNDINITASHNGNYMDSFTTEYQSEKIANASIERFYFEVGGAFSFCNAEKVGDEKSYAGKNLVKIGRACWGCMEGEMTINSTGNNSVMWISYDDEKLEEGFWGVLSGAAGGGCLCCAGVFLLIGIILVFTVKGDKQQAVMSPYAASDANSPLAGEQPSTPDIHQREF